MRKLFCVFPVCIIKGAFSLGAGKAVKNNENLRFYGVFCQQYFSHKKAMDDNECLGARFEILVFFQQEFQSYLDDGCMVHC